MKKKKLLAKINELKTHNEFLEKRLAEKNNEIRQLVYSPEAEETKQLIELIKEVNKAARKIHKDMQDAIFFGERTIRGFDSFTK